MPLSNSLDLDSKRSLHRTRTCTLSTLLFCLAICGNASAQSSINLQWHAAGHLPPNQVCPAWQAVHQTPGTPTFSGDTMIIQTLSNIQDCNYMMSGTTMVLKSPTVIEFRLKYGPGAHDSIWETHVQIGFVGMPRYGNFLFIGQDQMFIWSTYHKRVDPVSVDTDDDFHDYRIEYDSSLALRVYHDNSLIITGSLFEYGNYWEQFPRVSFGDGDNGAHGESKWIYVRHNAYAFAVDTDGDSIYDSCDICINIHDPNQEDTDQNGIGDACCCIGQRGNADSDITDQVDIADLQIYVDFLFFGGPTAGCPNEFDTYGGDLAVDISDLQLIIDYLFFDIALPSCP